MEDEPSGIQALLQFPSGELAGEEGCDENRECDQMPAQSQEKTARDDKRNGDMNCQNPLPGESADPRSPIAEWDVNAENQNCRDPQ
jgi:hypothetical protein